MLFLINSKLDDIIQSSWQMYAHSNQDAYLSDPEIMARIITLNFKIKKNKKGKKPKKSNTNNNNSVGTSGVHMQDDDELDL